jgi:hypothetical protein
MSRTISSFIEPSSTAACVSLLHGSSRDAELFEVRRDHALALPGSFRVRLLAVEEGLQLQAKIAHLGFIQAIITRMGLNSFLLKGWSVTLVAAIFALSAKQSDRRFVLVALFPIAVFWLLDAFFLHQEKLYRRLYELVAQGEVKSDQFTLDTKGLKDVPDVVSVFFSKTLRLFYGSIGGVILFAMFKLLL